MTFFSRAHNTMQNTQDQFSVKETNYMPSFMFLAKYTLGKLCKMRSNYTPSLIINCWKRRLDLCFIYLSFIIATKLLTDTLCQVQLRPPLAID